MKARIMDARNRSGETQVDAGAERWLTNMARLTDEGSKIIQEEDRETGRCLMGLRPNLLACYRASKSAEKVMESADKLKKDGEGITTVAHVDYSKALGFAMNYDYEELESRKKSSEQIIAYLKDPSVRMVGMYGMGGTGKTTLAEKMGVQLYEDGTFRYVVKTNVSNSEETNLIHIQKQIADLLKISFKDDKDDVMARANHLREQLMKKDKVLIILDDVWSNFDLRNVGLPLDQELKILITSRDVNIMNDMNSKHNVPIDVLSPEDSWKLFNKMADGVATNSDRYSTALEVVEQCGGIPVLLVTIAKTLRNKDLETWKEALFQLNEFEGDNFVEDGYKRLEVSYNFLPKKELKSLFLLCAQLDHHSILIDDLLRYIMGLDLLNRKKLRDVRSRLYMHLNHLKGVWLLQDGITNEGEETVRMHDVVHKFATSIARDHHIFTTVAGVQLEKWPSKDELEQFSAISLPYCSLPPPNYQLPVAFESSKLNSFLLLQKRRYLEEKNFLKAHDTFFTGMKELKVIDIRWMSLSLSSFNVLLKLRTLCLDYCEFDDVSVIGELPMLQVLSVKGSTLSQIRSLGNSLKLLDLSDCRLQIFYDVLSNLTLLEDLRIGKSFSKWEPLQDCNSGTDHETLASVREFKNLANLINLDIHIPDTTTLSKDLVFEKLERYKIVIGLEMCWLPENSKSLGVRLGEDDSQLYEMIKVLIEKVKYVHLEELLGFASVCEIVPEGSEGFAELLELKVQSAEIQCIVKKHYNNCGVFPKLEKLVLYTVSKLERICDDNLMLPVGSFQNLTTIEVDGCDVLLYLFSSHLALRGLSCLKDIKVLNCESMESIVSRESESRITEVYQQLEDEEEIIEFAQLRELKLYNLGRFISFVCSPIISSSQERQEQDPTCSNQRLLTSLFNKKVVLPKLEQLELTRIRVDQIWDDQLPTEAGRINYCWVHNLKILKLERCNNLSYLFTSSMVKSLAQLKELKVQQCESIEEIIATRKGEEMTVGDEDADVKFSFPALETLQLTQLPKLRRFCGGPFLLDFPNLVVLDMYCCERLIGRFSFEKLDASLAKIITSPSLKYCQLVRIDFQVKYVVVSGDVQVRGGDCSLVSPIPLVELFHELKTMLISSFRVEELFTREHTQSISKTFASITRLKLSDLTDMKHIWSSELSADDQIHGFPQNLQVLKVKRCGSLMILAPKSASFPNLTRLLVRGCNELIRLVSSTTAKGLVNLTQMEVRDCDSLLEIVAIYDGEEGTEDIVFGKLKALVLVSLGNLTSFTTKNCNFQFPSLELVAVVECPNMEFLCKGDLSTPKLSKVYVDLEGEWQMWENDLNSTVRQLHKEMNLIAEESDLNPAERQFYQQMSLMEEESKSNPVLEQFYQEMNLIAEDSDYNPEVEQFYKEMLESLMARENDFTAVVEQFYKEMSVMARESDPNPAVGLFYKQMSLMEESE